MPTPRDDNYSAASGATVSAGISAAPYELIADGIWTWCDTIINAVEHGAYLYVMVVDSVGSNWVYRRHLTTGVLQSFKLADRLEVDDHNAGSLLFLPDGRVGCIYGIHNDSVLRWRVWNGVGDFTASGSWTVERRRGTGDGAVSYPQWFQLSVTGSVVYALMRRTLTGVSPDTRVLGLRTITNLSQSGDGSQATDPMSAFTNIYRSAGFIPYWQLWNDGVDTLHVTCTNMHPVQGQSSLYHFYGKVSAAGAWTWYKSDGTTIPLSQELTPADITLVYDGSVTRCWAYDLTLDSEGRPCILYCAYPGNNGDIIEYWHARWDGSQWVRSKITNDGAGLYSPEKFYAGSLCFDAHDPRTIYLSAPIGGVRQVQRWTTPDKGQTWAQQEVYTSGGSAGNPLKFRPYSPRRYVNGPRVLWLDGRYTTFTNYLTRVMAKK